MRKKNLKIYSWEDYCFLQTYYRNEYKYYKLMNDITINKTTFNYYKYSSSYAGTDQEWSTATSMNSYHMQLNGVFDGFATGLGASIGGFTEGLAVGGCGFAACGFGTGFSTIGDGVTCLFGVVTFC